MNRRSVLEFSPGAAGPVLARDETWEDRALCKEADPALWFSADAEDAQEICRHCPVRAECLAFAVSTGQRYGTWGGVPEEELRELISARIASGPRTCRKGLHAMTEANTRPDGRCRACKNAWDAQSYREQHPLGLGRGRTAEPRERDKEGRFTRQPIQADKEQAA